MNRQDTLKATAENKIAPLFSTYLFCSSETELVDFQNLATEINRVLDLAVSKYIIFYRLAVILSMVKISHNYDVVNNQNKIEKVLTILFTDESYRKDLLGQLIVMIILQNNMKSKPNTPSSLSVDIDNIINIVKKYCI